MSISFAVLSLVIFGMGAYIDLPPENRIGMMVLAIYAVAASIRIKQEEL